jgi:hypothetical protein
VADDVRIVPDEAAIRDLAGSQVLRAAVFDAAEELVPGARARAPHDTGAGAFSIHAEPVFDDGVWTARVGWDRDHYYMSFHQLGTTSLPARPFLEE